jgi:hypothetical protein
MSIRSNHHKAKIIDIVIATNPFAFGSDSIYLFFAERKAHLPLPAAVIAYGFGVLVTKNHLNRTSGSGYVMLLFGFFIRNDQ